MCALMHTHVLHMPMWSLKVKLLLCLNLWENYVYARNCFFNVSCLCAQDINIEMKEGNTHTHTHIYKYVCLALSKKREMEWWTSASEGLSCLLYRCTKIHILKLKKSEMILEMPQNLNWGYLLILVFILNGLPIRAVCNIKKQAKPISILMHWLHPCKQLCSTPQSLKFPYVHKD